MSKLDLNSKTVAELRKIAKEQGVTLGAGIQKAGIIAKLEAAMAQEADQEPEQAPAAAPAPVAAPASAAPAQPRQQTETPAAPAPQQGATMFHAAWRNPAPRYSSKPAYTAPQRTPGGYQGAQRPAMQDTPPRTGTVRPTNYTPRFGPEASVDSAPAPRQEEEYRTAGHQPQRPAYQQDRRPAYGEGGYGQQRPSFGPQQSYDQQRPAYDQQRPAYDQQRPAYNQQQSQYGEYGQPGYDQQPAAYDQQRPAYNQQQGQYGYSQRPAYNQQRSYADSNAPVSINLNELLAAGDCQDGGGVLEMHPDGYGFLRAATFQPSSKDIYISMAQIKRFNLRTGDQVNGKVRPQRDGDKYTAMLYITEVNGQSPDTLNDRPIYDELPICYPTRRITFTGKPDERNLLRMADLVAPMGFGQRGLLLCPPDFNKTDLLRDLANAMVDNYPDVTTMMLLIDKCPEDVSLFREQTRCPVLASTFNQPPENHLRLADMVLERAQRLVELGKDVVIVVDSLTRLAKTFTTAAAQQGRSMPGQVNPSSLFRAKKLFGAARCIKGGGTLTIIGAMDIETGSKVDDAVVEEFKGTANMELWLDSSLTRAGVNPPINLMLSGTKRAETLLTDPKQLEGLSLLRGSLSGLSAAKAITQISTLIANTSSNADLLLKVKDWLDMVKDGKVL